jgi:hypothetical protein
LALKALRKVLGSSEYEAHEGCNTGGANGVYWLERVTERPGGLVLVRNLTEGAKRQVETAEVVLEPNLIYPLLRGRDVERWLVSASAHIILAQDPQTRRGVPVTNMKRLHPRTFAYLNRFESALRSRAAFKRYFKPDDPFWSMFNIGPYTLARHKVVWREQASQFTAAVVPPASRPVLPDHKLMLVAVDTDDEAHYLCGMLNSSPMRLAVAAYAVSIQMNPHILENVRVPRFDPRASGHREIARQARAASESARDKRPEDLITAEVAIDEAAALVWGLTERESRDISASLEDLS